MELQHAQPGGGNQIDLSAPGARPFVVRAIIDGSQVASTEEDHLIPMLGFAAELAADSDISRALQ